MSLDKNLFTLLFTPHKDNPSVVDLVDPSGTVHYRKQRVPGNEYKIEVYDFMSQSLLITASAPAATAKVKSLELHNPTSVVEIKSTGTLSFKWSFKWEEHEFEWKREECFMIRKPDPPVIIAVTREPAGRLKTSQVQILDYNLNRFDINDRKGLEIVILTALMTFHDLNDAHHAPPETPTTSSPASNPLLGRPTTANTPASGGGSGPAPAPPPKPAPKTGVDRIAELQAGQGEYNEVIVSEEGAIPDYAAYCNKLLQDDAMLFVTLKTADASQVPKVLQVAQETKRLRHKSGEEEELHQYVLYDQDVKKGPRRINLDDDPKNKYEPPKNLTIHLSKISMPELQPKADVKKDNKKKDDKRASTPGYGNFNQPSRPAPPTPVSRPPSQPQPTSGPSTKPTGPNKLQRPNRPTSPNRIQNNQHNRPNPSPSQLNNPSMYGSSQNRPLQNKPPQSRPPQSQPPQSRPPQSQPPPQGRPPHNQPQGRPPQGPPNSAARPPAAPSPLFPQPSVPVYGSSPSPQPNWSSAPPPPPPLNQPPQAQPPQSQPPSSSNPLSNLATSLTGKPISASAVVSGLFDRLNQRRS